LIDYPLDKLEKVLKKLEDKFLLLAGAGAGGVFSAMLYMYCTNKEDAFKAAADTGKLYSLLLMAALAILQFLIKTMPLIRKFLKNAIDAANFYVIVVAGVTGNSYFTSAQDALALSVREPTSIALVSATSGMMTLQAKTVLNIAVSAVSLLVSHTIFSEVKYETLALGLIIAVNYMTLAIDSFHSAVMASMTCILMQKHKDSLASPGNLSYFC